MEAIEKDVAIVEIESGKLIAFDLPYEGVCYQIPNFKPGLYRIPLSAIRSVQNAHEAESAIYVDTGTIFFVDADFRGRLGEIESRIWDETGDSYEIMNRHDAVVRELGIRFDFLTAPGVGMGYDFQGDGSYYLDLSNIKRIP
jgi:hypothetical protein